MSKGIKLWISKEKNHKKPSRNTKKEQGQAMSVSPNGSTPSKKMKVCNKPKYVYIPLINGTDTDITTLVKKGDYVYKGTALGRRKGALKIPIISSVSGIVVDFVSKTIQTGESVRCVQIENDFQERYEENRMIRKERVKLNKEEFMTILHDNGIIGMGGAGFPTYVKYASEKIKTLVVNAVECEPYITADYALLKEHPEEVLEGIDMIMESNHIESCVLAIKKTNAELAEILNNFIGTYVRIKIVLVPALYPMGWERNLIRETLHEEYDKLPIEKGIVVNNVSTIYAIYEALKFNRPLTERIVTFTGSMLKAPQDVVVKVGMEAKEILSSLLEKTELENKDVLFVAGGPMMGVALPQEELIITPNLNCVCLLPKKEIARAKQCIRCGKCVQVCPAKLSPVLIKDHIEQVESLKALEVNRCVECGLCSYICPSKIFVREYVKLAKEKLRESEENGK